MYTIVLNDYLKKGNLLSKLKNPVFLISPHSVEWMLMYFCLRPKAKDLGIVSNGLNEGYFNTQLYLVVLILDPNECDIVRQLAGVEARVNLKPENCKAIWLLTSHLV